MSQDVHGDMVRLPWRVPLDYAPWNSWAKPDTSIEEGSTRCERSVRYLLLLALRELSPSVSLVIGARTEAAL